MSCERCDVGKPWATRPGTHDREIVARLEGVRGASGIDTMSLPT